MDAPTDPNPDEPAEAGADAADDPDKHLDGKRKRVSANASPTAPPSSPLKPMRKRSCAGVCTAALATALEAAPASTRQDDPEAADAPEAEATLVHTDDAPGGSDELLVFRSHPEAILPTKISAASVGYDLCWCSFAQDWQHDAPDRLPDCAGIETVPRALIEPGKTVVMATGLIMAPPAGCYLRVAPRSGLSVMGVHVGAGVVDPDYRGKIGVVVHNLSKDCMVFEHGERIAQIVVERYSLPKVVELTKENAPDAYEAFMHPPSERGSKGFGSSGRF